MIDFSKYTQSYLQAEMLARVPNTLDKREGSLIYTALSPIAWLLSLIFTILNQMQTNSYVETAIGNYLDKRCEERGIARKKASASIRLVYFDIEVKIGSRFATINGENSVNFKVTEYIEKRQDGYYYYKAECETVGVIGNGYTGSITTIGFIDKLTVAQMTDILIAGTEDEDDESLKARYIASLQQKPFAGNYASYIEEVSSYDGVGAIQIYPIWKGGGTVKISIIDSNFDPCSDVYIAEIQKKVCPIIDDENANINDTDFGFGIAPIGAQVTIGTAEKFNIDVSCAITLTNEVDKEQATLNIQKALEKYFLGLRKQWGKNRDVYAIKYEMSVLLSQVTASITNSEGVWDCQDVHINGDTQNVVCDQTAERQVLPYLGNLEVKDI